MTEAGKMFDAFVGTLILLNVVAVIAESEPSLGNMPGPAGEKLQAFFDAFEVSLVPHPVGTERLVDGAWPCLTWLG